MNDFSPWISQSRLNFITGVTDVYEIDDVLSMWRVEGVVYAVTWHPDSPDSHLVTIRDYMRHWGLPGGGLQHFCPEDRFNMKFNGVPVSDDEIITVNDER